MSAAIPDGICPVHPSAKATFLCPRCGKFGCAQCEHRTRPDAQPICTACWELRAKVVEPEQRQSKTRMQTTALVLGCVSCLPIPALMIASLVVCIMALVKAKEPESKAVRWKPALGLAITLLSILFWAAVILLGSLADDS
jgi:hypothetical protein